MKWIGQHIYDLIARFRSDVYLEDIDTGTIASGGNLGLDTNNKIVKAPVSSGGLGDITGVDLTGNSPINIGSETGTTGGDYSATIGVDSASTTALGVVELATTAETTTGTDTIRVVTPDGLKDGYQGSSNITTVGIIGSGSWRGDAINSIYLDSDTAHLTTNQTFTGVKTFNEAINKKALHFVYTSNKFTLTTATETYFSLADADRDVATGNEDGVAVMMVCPLSGILKHVIINTSSNLSAKTWEFRVYRVPSGANATSGGEILIATVASNVGPASHTNKVVSFVSATADTNVITYETGYDAETMFTAGDRVLFSLESNSDATGSPKINAALCFELDESTI
jgi:hypothetical protein